MYSDAIYIIPALSFSEEHHEINTEAIPDNKQVGCMTQHDNEQNSEVIVVTHITTPH
jgi:hypothetical protein